MTAIKSAGRGLFGFLHISYTNLTERFDWRPEQALENLTCDPLALCRGIASPDLRSECAEKGEEVDRPFAVLLSKRFCSWMIDRSHMISPLCCERDENTVEIARTPNKTSPPSGEK